MKQKGVFLVVGLCLGLFTGFSTAQAQLLYSQSFESLSTGSLNGQGGFNALSAATVTASGISYSSGAVSVTGGSQSGRFTGLTPANNWTLSNTFTSQTGTVYFSLAMTWTNQDVNDLLMFGISDGVHGYAGPGGASGGALTNTGAIRISNNGGVTAAGQVLGMIRNTGSGDQLLSASGVTPGGNTSTPVFVIGKLSKVSSSNYNTLDLFVNPSSLTEGAPTVSLTYSLGISSLNTFYMFSGSNNESDEVVGFDNIRIGTTFNSVVAAVPEPSTWALMAFGLGALAVLRLRGRSSKS